MNKARGKGKGKDGAAAGAGGRPARREQTFRGESGHWVTIHDRDGDYHHVFIRDRGHGGPGGAAAAAMKPRPKAGGHAGPMSHEAFLKQTARSAHRNDAIGRAGSKGAAVANARASLERRRSGRAAEKRYHAATAHRAAKGKPTDHIDRLKAARALKASRDTRVPAPTPAPDRAEGRKATPRPPTAKPKPAPRPKPTPKPTPTAPKPTPKPAPAIPGTDPHLPEHVEHRAFIASEHAGALERGAKELGTAPHELRSRLDAQLKAAVAEGDLYLRVDSGVLPEVLAEGRFKTQFETGTSRGQLDAKGRYAAEAKLFGHAPASSPATKPIYGYVGGKDFSTAGRYPEHSLDNYGDAAVKLKAHVRDRATITVGDSLSVHDRVVGSPAASPGAGSLPIPSHGGHWLRNSGREFLEQETPKAALEHLMFHNRYVEAQYHGGLRVEDIEEVAFIGAPPPQVRAQLDRHGIKWRQYRHQEGG